MMHKNLTHFSKVAFEMTSFTAFKWSCSRFLTLLEQDAIIANIYTYSRFQMTLEKPKPKQLLRPITTGADSAMNQSQFPAITCKAREKSLVHGAIGFGFASHWLKNWHESFKPITKRSNRNHVITSDSHLKTALKYSFNSRFDQSDEFL